MAGGLLFWCWLRYSAPVYLCNDIQCMVHTYLESHTCCRCGAIIESRRRVAACFVRGERLCFTCWNKARWPQG